MVDGERLSDSAVEQRLRRLCKILEGVRRARMPGRCSKWEEMIEIL